MVVPCKFLATKNNKHLNESEGQRLLATFTALSHIKVTSHGCDLLDNAGDVILDNYETYVLPCTKD